jgi:hypothetical protein
MYETRERPYEPVNFFAEQFSMLDHNAAPNSWTFMGTEAVKDSPGMVVDVYRNFVTGAWENRNLRNGELK